MKMRINSDTVVNGEQRQTSIYLHRFDDGSGKMFVSVKNGKFFDGKGEQRNRQCGIILDDVDIDRLREFLK